MIALWLALGLFAGTIAGWMLCACVTAGHERDQQVLICRLRMALRTFIEITEHEHDDVRIAGVIKFSRTLLKEDR